MTPVEMYLSSPEVWMRMDGTGNENQRLTKRQRKRKNKGRTTNESKTDLHDID